MNITLLSKVSGILRSVTGEDSVGLSIGTSSIKIAELKQMGRNQWKLLNFGIIQLPMDTVVNREIVNNIGVVEHLRQLIKPLKLKSSKVATSVSGRWVVVKKIVMDLSSEKDLADQAHWEIEQYLPFPIEDAVVDYQMLSPITDNRAEVLLVGVRKSILESYMGCIRDVGLTPKHVDLDYFALQSIYEENYPAKENEAVALVDIGASSTKVVVLQEKAPVFTKDLPLGGNHLTTNIQKHLNLNFHDAEMLKVGQSAAGLPQEVLDLMMKHSQSLGKGVHEALKLYQASSSKAPLSGILLAGGGSKVPRLSETLERQLGVATQMMNPFNAIHYDPEIFTHEYIKAIAPIAALPIGLAIKERK